MKLNFKVSFIMNQTNTRDKVNSKIKNGATNFTQHANHFVLVVGPSIASNPAGHFVLVERYK